MSSARVTDVVSPGGEFSDAGERSGKRAGSARDEQLATSPSAISSAPRAVSERAFIDLVSTCEQTRSVAAHYGS